MHISYPVFSQIFSQFRIFKTVFIIIVTIYIIIVRFCVSLHVLSYWINNMFTYKGLNLSSVTSVAEFTLILIRDHGMQGEKWLWLARAAEEQNILTTKKKNRERKEKENEIKSKWLNPFTHESAVTLIYKSSVRFLSSSKPVDVCMNTQAHRRQTSWK